MYLFSGQSVVKEEMFPVNFRWLPGLLDGRVLARRAMIRSLALKDARMFVGELVARALLDIVPIHL